MNSREELTPEEAQDLASIRQRPSRLRAKSIGSVMQRLMTQRGYGQTKLVDALQEGVSLSLSDSSFLSKGQPGIAITLKRTQPQAGECDPTHAESEKDRGHLLLPEEDD